MRLSRINFNTAIIQFTSLWFIFMCWESWYYELLRWKHSVCVFWKCWRHSEKTRGARKNCFWAVLKKILKVSNDKCHLVSSINERFLINIIYEVIKHSNDKKLLRVDLNNRLGFDTHVINICNRVSKKLYALARISHFMSIHKQRITMKASEKPPE